jgi:hypothetical protein
MHPNDRQKMCGSCDGRIPLEATVCPYCTASQSAYDPSFQHNAALQDKLTSLYTPPYSAKSSQAETNLKFKVEKEPMKEKRFSNANAALGVPTIPQESLEEAHAHDEKSAFWPLLWLSIGANLLMLGLLQLFFSDNGWLRLEWDSSYWFIYCLAALPLFFFGFKKANQLG